MGKKKAKKLVITAGVLALMLFTPVANSPVMNTVTNRIEVQAAESLPYSSNWETQSDGSWKYKLNSGQYASGWIQDEVDKNWYYMDSNKVMLSGLVKSNDNKYYLLSEEHDGHFGHMITNGEVYKGITIKAEASGDYAGALSQESINAIKSLGLNVSNATDVSGSQHVTGGEVVFENTVSSSTNSEMTGATFGNNIPTYNTGGELYEGQLSANGLLYWSNGKWHKVSKDISEEVNVSGAADDELIIGHSSSNVKWN